MSGARWLAVRELRARPSRAALAAAVVASATALGAGMELLARSREVAAGARVDGMGAAIRIVPPGVGGSALARLDFGDALLPSDAARRVAETLGHDLRALHARRVVMQRLGDRRVPFVGEATVRGGTVELGPALASRLQDAGPLQVGGRVLEVGRTREPAGNAEDAAAHVSLETAQALAGTTGVNELQVFLRAGVRPAEARARLETARLGARVLAANRGEVADEGIQGALARARRLAQGVLAVIVVLGLAVAAHLDAAERRVEAATLVALGAVPGTVLWTLVGRSLAIGAAGGLLGTAAGAALAIGSEPALLQTLRASWPALALAPLVNALLGAAAAGPVAIAMARRDPVAALQE